VPTNDYDAWMVKVSPDSGELRNTPLAAIYNSEVIFRAH
jgi:hypothetical protein